MKLAVLMPSRGLLAGPMRESVDAACKGYAHHPFYTHNRPLPECFNELGERVLTDDFTHALFVEEDMIIPDDAIPLLLEVDADIAAINYATHLTHPTTGKPWMSSYWWHDRLLWVSLGCTMVRRRVFEGLERPWFRTDLDITSTIIKGEWILGTHPRDPKKYGGQDSMFCYRAVEAGFTLGETLKKFAIHLPPLRPKEVEGNAGEADRHSEPGQ